MKKLLATMLAVVLLLVGCNKNKLVDTKKDSETPTTVTPEATTELAATNLGIQVNFAPGFNRDYPAYQPLDVVAKAPLYTVAADLSNIENIHQFQNLTAEQMSLIATNGFAVAPTDSEQLFYIYEDNAYKKIPSFVTVDSVLQLFHIFYDYSLRNIESDFFHDDLIRLNENMLNQLMKDKELIKDQALHDQYLTMIGYFGVANLALGQTLPSSFPEEIRNLCERELVLIRSATGQEKSPLFGFEVDYSLFTVRGHYTRSDLLSDYFRAMAWYGTMPMPFYDREGNKDEDSALRAILTTVALARLPKDQGGDLWENIYSVTSFYVGEADDFTPYDIAAMVETVYGQTPDMNDIDSDLDLFYTELDKHDSALIISKDQDAQTGKQMRFMGQRYIPDSEILQNLSEPFKRPIPTAVDIFAVFGGERAQELLDELYRPTVLWEEYQTNFDSLKEKFDNQSIDEQTSNIYTSWLYSLKSLIGRVGEGYPIFMQNTAWDDKSLHTALGSWSEIRHDSILYGKQSAAEAGNGDEPDLLMSYVEPNPEFFNRLLWLLESSAHNLQSRHMLSEDMSYKLNDFKDLLSFLKNCALKELQGEDLSEAERYSLLTFGGTLEYLSSSIAESDSWYLIESDTDKNMAVIADVHTAGGLYLEEGVGEAAEILVAISQNGKIYLTRGAVFDFFEFTSDVRLTDEAWQIMLKENPPEKPPFTQSFMGKEKAGEISFPGEP